MHDLALEMLHITKSRSGIRADDDITLGLRRGEIHGLLGDSGAGKTTLADMLGGLTTPDEGEIRVNGKKARIRKPHKAAALGIGIAPQQSGLIEDFTVLENLLLGSADAGLGVLRKSRARKKAAALSRKYGLEVELDALVRDLPAGARKRAEILKLLYRDSQILILDEPAAVLTPQETEWLTALLRFLAREGKAILLLSRKPREILAAADQCTVLRKGRVVGAMPAADATEEALTRLMTGRGALFATEKKEISVGSVVLEARDVTAEGNVRGKNAVKNASFEVRAGEIVCLTGIEGNGQRELVSALTGLIPLKSGRIRLNGEEISRLSIRGRIRAGISHIPEDRSGQGLAPDLTLAENLALRRYWSRAFQESGFIKQREVRRHAQRLMDEYDLSADQGIWTLGRAMTPAGRQQAVAAREMDRDSDLMIAVEPTAGLDAEAADALRRQILSVRDSRRAVLLVSQDLDEVMHLADRILVMHGGEIVGSFDPLYTTRQELGLYMAGTLRQGEEDRFDED